MLENVEMLAEKVHLSSLENNFGARPLAQQGDPYPRHRSNLNIQRRGKTRPHLDFSKMPPKAVKLLPKGPPGKAPAGGPGSVPLKKK